MMSISYLVRLQYGADQADYVLMTWAFETDPDFQRKLDWVDEFVRQEVEPLDLVLRDPYDKSDAQAMAIVRPLQEQVKAQKLWACHLDPELGGEGYGQVKLALLNEILGRSVWAPSVFGCQAPDSGNAEILARYGTPEQKERYLRVLLDGEITSCYSMTEPQAGSDPGLFTTKAVRDGDTWVINGEKWFSSNARYASFFIVMAVTDPALGTRGGMSMFIVPAETPGIEIIRNVGVGTESEDTASHAYMRYNDVRVPHDHLLGAEGAAFEIAQARLGGGRIHHAMRTIAQIRRAFEMMLERAVSRQVRAGTLGSQQLTQEKIAETWIEMEQFRLLVLRTAWLIDKYQDYNLVKKDISAVKAAMPKAYYNAVIRAMHLHGSLGISNEMPFSELLVNAEVMALADGPTEIHHMSLAKELLKTATPATGLFPTEHLPTRRAAAHAKLAHHLDHLLDHAAANH
jgi:acyl-CoA dehydrogenase